MGKLNFSELKQKGIDTAKIVYADVKEHWNKPREGEFLSYKAFAQYCLGAMGINVFSLVTGWIFFGNGYFCGAIMGLAIKDFTTLNIISTIFSYLFLFMSPINMLLYENHGRLPKKQAIVLHVFCISRILAAIGLYFVNPELWTDVIPLAGWPQLIANNFIIGAFFDYMNWLIRRLFSQRYGRVKPFVVLYAIPAAVCYSIIPFLPLDQMSYTDKFVLLHAACSIAGTFNASFMGYGGIVNFLTQNTQERQRIISLAPIITGLLRSIIKIFLTMLISITIMGYTLKGLEDIMTYRIYVPILSVIAVVAGSMFLPVKENLIEQRVDRPPVKFFKGAKQVFKNKYIWLGSVGGFLAGFCFIGIDLVGWWMTYNMRSLWMSSLVGSLISFGSVGANLITPYLTRKFDKVKIYKVGRVCQICVIPIFFMFYKFNLFWPYVIFNFFSNSLDALTNGIYNSFNGDIMDYHQWRFGERCDSTQGLTGWIFSPITLGMSYIGPWIFQELGYTSDWGVLYDRNVLDRMYTTAFICSFIGSVLSAIPFLFFYDITSEKHKKWVEEIRERTRLADIEAVKRRIEIGNFDGIEDYVVAQLLEEGIDVEALKAAAASTLDEVVETGEVPA